MRVDTFSQEYCPSGGFVRGMDARAKMAFAACCLALCVGSSSAIVPLAAGVTCMALLAVSGVPARAVVFRAAEPVVFAVFIGVIQAFLIKGEPIAGFDIAGYSLSASREGLARGGYIVARVSGSVMVVLFLTMTTPVERLLSAAAWMKLPRGFVEVSIFAYRYVFILLEDAVTIYHAQRGRLGYAGLRRGLGSVGTLAGSVFLRAFSQAEATGAAMAQRGYSGSYLPACTERLKTADAAVLGGLLAGLSVVSLWTL